MEESANKEITLDSKIEAVLFFKSEPISIKNLAKALETDTDSVEKALIELENNLKDRGITLLRLGEEVSLGTSKKVSNIIEKITKEELTRDLGKAGLETLSIILYKSPISRREIDYIRGVNSNFILRNLLIRGLVEKVQNENDQRSFLYKPTMELLSFMGVNKITDLPDYQKVLADIENFNKEEEKEEKQEVVTQNQTENQI